jgi:hypothetical protein
MARRSKAERRRRARRFFRVLFNILSLGVAPILRSRGGKAAKVGNVVDGVARGAGEALED